jgi:preprotein translocase subunit Sec63
MMTQYNPDKANNLADDFKDLAERKSKEINKNMDTCLPGLNKKKVVVLTTKEHLKGNASGKILD